MSSLARLTRVLSITCACLTVVGCGQFPRKRSVDATTLAPRQAAEIQIALGRSLESEGDFEKAMAAYGQAIQADPRRAEAQVRMAIALDRLGRFTEAAPYYDAALKASPGDAEIFCDRGYSLALQGRNAEAEAALRQAIAKQPRLARAHNNLGLLLGRTGRADEALAEFRKAGCTEPDSHLNLAVALSENKRWSEARHHIAKARELGKNSGDVSTGAVEIESLIASAETHRPKVPALDADILPARAVTADTPRK